MSNNVTIQRREVKRLDSGIVWSEAHIFDDSGNLDSVCMDYLPENALVLFEFIVDTVIREGCSDSIENILAYLQDSKAGITVDGYYCDYKYIKSALNRYFGDNTNE